MRINEIIFLKLKVIFYLSQKSFSIMIRLILKFAKIFRKYFYLENIAKDYEFFKI